MSVPFWVWPQSVLWVLAHVYLWARLVRGTTSPGGAARRVGTVAAVVLSAFIPAALISAYTLSPDVARWFNVNGPRTPDEVGALYADLVLRMVGAAEK